MKSFSTTGWNGKKLNFVSQAVDREGVVVRWVDLPGAVLDQPGPAVDDLLDVFVERGTVAHSKRVDKGRGQVADEGGPVVYEDGNGIGGVPGGIEDATGAV